MIRGELGDLDAGLFAGGDRDSGALLHSYATGSSESEFGRGPDILTTVRAGAAHYCRQSKSERLDINEAYLEAS